MMARTETNRKGRNKHSVIGAYKNMLTHEERDLAKKIKEMADISDIKVNSAHTKKQRIRSFIEQAGDPYCLKYGTAVIEMIYSEEGGSLQESITAVFI